ncbi:MAG: hypothetical protein ABI321_09160 [Polyangia bacterium]
MSQRPDLASLVVAKKLANLRQVERAREHEDEPLWRGLIADKVLSISSLFALLRDHSKVPVVPAAMLASHPPLELLEPILRKRDALLFGMLPLELSADGRRVQMAMVDPTDSKTLRGLAQSAGFESAKVFLVEHAELVAAVERAYAAPVRDSVEPAGKVGQRSEQESSDRLEQVLVQATLGLGSALERELGRGLDLPSPLEAARLAREVARELGHDRRRVALAGVAAQLVQLDELQRARSSEESSPSLFDELGWAAGGDDGLLGIARALTAQAAGFQRPQHAGATQRVVQAVIDYLGLVGAERGESAGVDATVQLLRTSSTGAPVMDALLRVLRREMAEHMPAAATLLPRPDSVVTTPRASVPRFDAERPLVDERTQLVKLPGVPSTPEPPPRKR